ncbi:unnamed protein product [Symbiodinium sp. CCMP2456]|nr:unnamed protein product [Symbiodinium sp. CCMP2456]
MVKQPWTAALVHATAQHHEQATAKSCGYLLASWGAGRAWQAAARIFADAPTRGLEVNIRLCNAAINACRHAWQCAGELLHRASACRLQHDSVSLGAVSASLCRGRQWPTALALLGSGTGAVALGAITDAAAKVQAWRTALSRLQQWRSTQGPPGVVLLSSAGDALQRSQEWRKAVEILSPLVVPNGPADAAAYGVLLAACAGGGRWSEAKELLSSLRLQRLRADVAAFGAAVRSAEAKPEVAETLALEMRQRGMHPSAALRNAVAVGARWDEALRLFGRCASYQLEVDTVGGNIAASACAQEHQWQNAASILDLGTAWGLPPDSTSLHARIQSFGWGLRWETSLRRMADSQLDEGAAAHVGPSMVGCNLA